MADDEQSFHDPQLKAAVQKAFGSELAPVSLRNRILVELDGATLSASTPKPRVERPAWFRFAVAALVFLGIAAGVVNYLYYEPTPAYEPSEYAYSLPIDFRDAMVSAHSEAPPGEFTSREVAHDRLSARLGRKVLAPDLKGWTFKGASAVTIMNQPGARAVYQRGDATISLFSIVNPSDYTTPDNINYDQTCGETAIAGLVKSGMIYCVITSPATHENAIELKQLREQFSKGL